MLGGEEPLLALFAWPRSSDVADVTKRSARVLFLECVCQARSRSFFFDRTYGEMKYTVLRVPAEQLFLLWLFFWSK